jgi:hypothetical protein
MMPESSWLISAGMGYVVVEIVILQILIMKKVGRGIALWLLLLLSMNGLAQGLSFKNLVGRWESSDGAGIEVVDSARIFLLYNGDKKQVLSYETNFSKTPCWFDFTVGSDSSNNISMKSLLLFVNDDLLQWQIFEDDRPANFSADKGTMVYLRRKK